MLFDTSGSVELDMKAYADPAQGGTATVSPQTAAAGQLMVYVAAMGAAALLMGAAVAVRKRKEG